MIILRELKNSDEEYFFKFIKNLSKEIVENYNHLFSEKREEWAKKLLSENSLKIIVLDDSKNEIIGFGHLTINKEYPGVPSLGIVINQNYRGKGIGKQIMQKLMEEGKTKKFKAIYLSVFKKNTIAKKLYDSLGFKTIGETFNDSGESWKMRYDFPI